MFAEPVQKLARSRPFWPVQDRQQVLNDEVKDGPVLLLAALVDLARGGTAGGDGWVSFRPFVTEEDGMNSRDCQEGRDGLGNSDRCVAGSAVDLSLLSKQKRRRRSQRPNVYRRGDGTVTTHLLLCLSTSQPQLVVRRPIDNHLRLLLEPLSADSLLDAVRARLDQLQQQSRDNVNRLTIPEPGSIGDQSSCQCSIMQKR